jgi:hypoxia up-regulated 1
VSRFPHTHYPYIKALLAATEVPNLPVWPQPPVLTEEGTLIFAHPSVPDYITPAPDSHDAVWTPTELLAHQLAYYRGLAEETAGEPVSQVVVTVPPWWGQAQRRAYRDALELQGLQCLAMISEGTGVALNYAMTRTFPDFDPETGLGEKEYHVVYDSGGLSTSATVLALYQTSYKPSPKSSQLINTTHIDVVSVGYEDVGSVHLDLAVQQMITDDFIQQSGFPEVRDDPRAMAKLHKEAVRVKHILSANQESNVAIESLYNDVDFRTKLTRAKLEARFRDIERFTHPLKDALAAANLNLSDLSSVLLFGGNTRVPFVQSALRDLLGDKEDLIAQGVNTDEAAVLGAAFYGAGLSRQFKMKSIEAAERSFSNITYGDDVVFPAGSVFGERKSILLKPEDDMTLEFAQGGNKILGVTLADVKGALANFTSPSPVVNMTLRLDQRGIFSVANVALVSNETTTDDKAEGGVAGALKGLFGKKDAADGAEAADADDEDEAAAAAANDTNSKPAVKPRKERIPIKFRESAIGFKPMTGEEKRLTAKRLSSIAAFEAARAACDEARNLLEGYLYRLQDLLSDDAENRALHDYATVAERKRLGEMVGTAFEWLHEHADEAKIDALLAKRTELETIEAPIITRFKEWRVRGKAVENFQQAMFAGRAFLMEAAQNRTEALEAAAAAPADKPVAPPKFTQEELDGVRDILKDNEQWIDPLMKVQATLEGDKTADPVIFAADMDERGKKLQMHVQRLEKKRQPRAPRPPKPSATEEPAAQETGEPEAEPASSSSSAPKEEETPAHDEL